MNTPKIFIKVLRLFFILVFSVTFISIFATIFSLRYFSKTIGKSPNYLLETIRDSAKSNPYESKDKINFLILGLDKRDDSLEKTTTTDTIIFASLDLKSYKLKLISTPRDLWFYPKNTKINGLYPMALETGSDQFNFLKTNFQQLYGQSIDHVVIITTDNLINFVNLIGGVDLYLEKGFTDNQYPNPDYIKNPVPSIPKYKTISFPSGQIHLDQTNITEFVRSRKGAETAIQGGTDIGRIQRQQLLIEAILAKVKSGQLINNFDQIKNLYYFWDKDLSKTLTDKDIIQIADVLGENITQISINKIDIPIGTTAKNGIIYHPNKFINKQWVFITADEQYQAFQKFINDSIASK